MPARGIISAMSLDSVSSQQSAPAPAYRPTATVQAIGSRWGVAAGHALAAEAAAHVLGAGGNAIDAGVAAGLRLGGGPPAMASAAGGAPLPPPARPPARRVPGAGGGACPAAPAPGVFPR